MTKQPASIWERNPLQEQSCRGSTKHRIFITYLTIIFIFVVLSTTFRPMRPLAFFMSDSGTHTERVLIVKIPLTMNG